MSHQDGDAIGMIRLANSERTTPSAQIVKWQDGAPTLSAAPGTSVRGPTPEDFVAADSFFSMGWNPVCRRIEESANVELTLAEDQDEADATLTQPLRFAGHEARSSVHARAISMG